MQKKYRNQTSEQLCNFVLKIMIFKNLIPSIWTKPPRRLELIVVQKTDTLTTELL